MVQKISFPQQSLTLLEYMLKTGSDRVPQQSLENIHVIKALTEYRYTDKDGKDQVPQVFFYHYMNDIYTKVKDLVMGLSFTGGKCEREGKDCANAG